MHVRQMPVQARSKIALHLALLQHYTSSKLLTVTCIMCDIFEWPGAPDEAVHCLTLYSMSYAAKSLSARTASQSSLGVITGMAAMTQQQ